MASKTLETFDALWTHVEACGLENLAPHETARGGAPTDTLPDLPPLQPEPGSLEVGEVIGQGGMGLVHAAHQAALEREVAVKRLRPGAPPSAARSLVEEARHMGALQHPNIIPVHALGLDDEGQPALVMKRIEGVTWKALIHDPAHPGWAGGAWSEDPMERHLEVLLQVCRAVQFAHSRGVLHRDLKPDNVMVGPFGEVYVVDWGLARRTDADPGPWRLVGTPAYLAPEMARRDAPQTEATDLYLLGGCLYEALVGETPHRGETLKDLLRNALSGEPPPLPPALPVDLADLLRTALATDPTDRPADVAAFVQDVQGSLRRGAVRRMVRVADAQLAEVETAEVPEETLREAELGYRSALAQWPESPGASAGLQTVYRRQAQRALDRDDVDAAEVALSRLQALDIADDGLAASVAKARHAWDALRARAAEIDPRVALRTRVRFFAAAQVVIALGTLLQWPQVADRIASYSAGYLFALLLPFLVLIGGGFVAVAGKLWQPGVNRQVALFEGWTILLIGLNRLSGWLADRHPDEILLGDLYLTTLAAACAGLYIRTPFGRWALLGLAVAVVATVLPASIPYGFTLLSAASAVLALTMRWDDWDTVARTS